jgi:hypothetical protein
MRFLPVRLVEVDSRRPALEHRQFIELAYWMPRNPGTWTLIWALYEVVRDDLVSVTRGDLVTVQGPSPPVTADFDLPRLVSVRANADGDAEWAVQGDRPRVEPIRSRAERENAQQSRARSTAERSVEAGRAGDVARTPTFSYADASGCGNARPFVFGWSADRKEAMTISADKAALQLSTRARSFDLARTQADLIVIAHLFEQPVRTWRYCTDAGAGPLNETAWRAVGGTVTIQMSPPGIRAQEPQLYQLSITIAGAEFANGTGARVRQSAPIRLEATAGSGP